MVFIRAIWGLKCSFEGSLGGILVLWFWVFDRKMEGGGKSFFVNYLEKRKAKRSFFFLSSARKERWGNETYTT